MVPPTTPKDVTFPLSDDDFHKMYAAAGTHGGLMTWVKENSKGYDLKSPDAKNSLRKKTTDNHVRASVEERHDTLDSSLTRIPYEPS